MGWEAQAWHTLLPHRASWAHGHPLPFPPLGGLLLPIFLPKNRIKTSPLRPPSRAGKVAKPLVSACWVVTASVGSRTPDAHLQACPAFTHTVDLGTLWHLTPLASSSPGNPK